MHNETVIGLLHERKVPSGIYPIRQTVSKPRWLSSISMFSVCTYLTGRSEV